jgi:hypothetical protein
MLRDTIAECEAKRLDEAQYLARVQEIMESILAHTDGDIPAQGGELMVLIAWPAIRAILDDSRGHAFEMQNAPDFGPGRFVAICES